MFKASPLADSLNIHLRQSTSASFNPHVQRDKLDERHSSLRDTVARDRSELQAFYIVISWLKRAGEPPKKKQRRT